MSLENYPYHYLAVTTATVLYTKWRFRKYKLQKKIVQYKACKLKITNYKRRKEKVKITIAIGESIDDVNNALKAISELENFEINTVTRIGHRKFLLERKTLPEKISNHLKGDITKIPIAQDTEGQTFYYKLFETATMALLMPSGSGKTTFMLSILYKFIDTFKKYPKIKLIITVIDFKRGVDFQSLVKRKIPNNIEVRILPSDDTDAILDYINELNIFYKDNMEKRKEEYVDFDYKLKDHNIHHLAVWDELEHYTSLKGIEDKELRNKISKIIKFCDTTSAVHRSNAINSVFITQSSKVSDLNIKLTNINLLLFSRISKEQADYFSINRNFLKNKLGKGKFILKEESESHLVRGIYIGTNEQLMKKKL